MLRLKMFDRTLREIQVYATSANALYPEFVGETFDALRRG